MCWIRNLGAETEISYTKQIFKHIFILNEQIGHDVGLTEFDVANHAQ